jgi:hypothetical protein
MLGAGEGRCELSTGRVLGGREISGRTSSGRWLGLSGEFGKKVGGWAGLAGGWRAEGVGGKASHGNTRAINSAQVQRGLPQQAPP